VTPTASPATAGLDDTCGTRTVEVHERDRTCKR
jgi:hypothetical protein